MCGSSVLNFQHPFLYQFSILDMIIAHTVSNLGIYFPAFHWCIRKKIKLTSPTSKETIVTADQEENVHSEQQKSPTLDQTHILSNRNEKHEKLVSSQNAVQKRNCHVTTKERYFIGQILLYFSFRATAKLLSDCVISLIYGSTYYWSRGWEHTTCLHLKWISSIRE